MRHLIIYLLLFGLVSCRDNNDSKDSSIKDNYTKSSTNNKQTEKSIKKELSINQKIVLSESKIDTFHIPFLEKNMLLDLKNYYKPYSVEAKIGQQDGPDFPYIDITKNEGNSIAFLSFDYKNKYALNEIRIIDSTVIDQYGIRVGDSYQKIIEKRVGDFKNTTNYHQHTYLYVENSNIYYELTGDLTITGDMLENIEKINLSEEQLQKCQVKYIIWRKRNK